MSTRTKCLLFVIFGLTVIKSVQAVRLEDVTIFSCINETDCEESFPSSTNIEVTTLLNEDMATEDAINLASNVTSNLVIEETVSESTTIETAASAPILSTKMFIFNNLRNNQTLSKRNNEICDCDVKVSSCDINCCCDNDCKQYQLEAFSHCKDHYPELYDSRYCYNRNFIARNNTPFLLEKLASNLFCILYDNLPPTYASSDTMVIKGYKDLQNKVTSRAPRWTADDSNLYSEYNISNTYHDGDIIWKLQEKILEPLEVPQSGFTGICSLNKKLRYLKDWKSSCMQTELSNENLGLFPTTYNNFSIISMPFLLNETYLWPNMTCPKTICLLIDNYYCKDSWNFCKNTSLAGFCTVNNICTNIVKGVRYIFHHNGTMGIKNVTAYFDIGNVTRSFYQRFEVIHEWIDKTEENSFVRSGNPGYTLGKPILFGWFQFNKTKNIETRLIVFNKTSHYLTLPLAQANGECGQTNRYIIRFGENVKLQCSLIAIGNTLTTNFCQELYNKTLHYWFSDNLRNITQISQSKFFVSKFGNITDNSTSNWIEILLNKIPETEIKGLNTHEEFQCTGLLKSINIDVLYSVLLEPESLTNYKILGIGITFSEISSSSWLKCNKHNCTNILNHKIYSYVSFHDISKPSKYYFVGGPYLDISLPYDFFYPFLGSFGTATSPVKLIYLLLIYYMIIIIY
ncbi:tectonic-3 [Prorops nasuta]|uniref:tectonic-3 n=1 Tax=Prorops nasuta TaxID=863751 RepID=UPI0034D012BF